MKFEDSKLPNEKVVVDAFNHAQESNKLFGPELKALIEVQIENDYQQEFRRMDTLKSMGKLTEEKYNTDRNRLEAQKKMEMRQLPLIVEMELERMFKDNVLAPALELHNNSENGSPVVLAAALLLASAPDPVDYEEIVAKFGKAVSDPLKNVLHINAHRGAEQQQANLAKASDGEKRIFKAKMTATLEQLAARAKRTTVTLQEDTYFRPIKQLWGNDKKQDVRLVDAFNKAAAAVNASYRIETVKVDEKTSYPQLVRNAPPPKPLPPVKKPPKIVGDDF